MLKIHLVLYILINMYRPIWDIVGYRALSLFLCWVNTVNQCLLNYKKTNYFMSSIRMDAYATLPFTWCWYNIGPLMGDDGHVLFARSSCKKRTFFSVNRCLRASRSRLSPGCLEAFDLCASAYRNWRCHMNYGFVFKTFWRIKWLIFVVQLTIRREKFIKTACI